MEEFVNIGSVVADDTSPTFDTFKFKANAYQYVFPGTLVGSYVNNHSFLIGRVAKALEVNPHESASRAKVREALEMTPDYPKEDFSTTIYRVYEVEIIEEAILDETEQIHIEQPSNMPVAGENVFCYLMKLLRTRWVLQRILIVLCVWVPHK